MLRSVPAESGRETGDSGRKKVTIVDVARAVGVSPSTVSYAISGTREISAEVKHRIFEKIRELDYRPSFFAQAMKNGSTRLIGIVADQCRNPSAAMFIDALTLELRKHSYDAMLSLAGLDINRGREMLHRFSSGLVDGVINLLPQIDPDEAALLCGKVPVVTNLRQQDALVQLDFATMAREILDYLWKLGHRKIGYIASRTRIYGAEDPAVRVFSEFASERGIRSSVIVYGEDTRESGESGAEQIYSRTPVSAIFTGNDEMAFGVYSWAYRRGLRIPDELSVVGYDDVPQAAAIVPPLTTARFPINEVAEFAVDSLLAKLTAVPDKIAPKMLHLPLVIRGSAASVRS